MENSERCFVSSSSLSSVCSFSRFGDMSLKMIVTFSNSTCILANRGAQIAINAGSSCIDAMSSILF